MHLWSRLGTTFGPGLQEELRTRAALGLEEPGRRMGRLRAALKRRAESSIVIVYAPAMDMVLRLVADGADQTVGLVPDAGGTAIVGAGGDEGEGAADAVLKV